MHFLFIYTNNFFVLDNLNFIFIIIIFIIRIHILVGFILLLFSIFKLLKKCIFFKLFENE